MRYFANFALIVVNFVACDLIKSVAHLADYVNINQIQLDAF